MITEESPLAPDTAVPNAAVSDPSAPRVWTLEPRDRDQPAGRVYALILDGQLTDFRRHESGVRADADPIHLHDYRVALRRARSLLVSGVDVFPSAPRRQLSAHMSTLNSTSSVVRDTDVLMGSIDERATSISTDLVDGVGVLRSALAERRVEAFDQLAGVLDDPSYQAMLRTWQLLGSVYRLGGDEPGPQAHTPTGEVVDAAIAAAFHKVRAAGRRANRSDRLEDWHDLRKRLKKLRYLVVAFAPMYPDGAMDPVVKRLRKLQNVLGRLQDHASEIELIESVGIGLGGRAALTAGALSDQLHRATDADRERCLGAWTVFDQHWVRDTLDAVFAGAES